MTYSEKLKNPRWQKKRLKILDRDNFTCTLCGDTETTLHVHHESYNGEPWEVEDSKLKTICEDCHSIVEILKNDADKKFTIPNIYKLLALNNDYTFVIEVYYDADKNKVVYLFFDKEKNIISFKYYLSKRMLGILIQKING